MTPEQAITNAIRRVKVDGLAGERRADRSDAWHRMREFAAAELTHRGTVTLDKDGVALIDAVTEIAYHLLIISWKGGPLEDEANWNLALMYSLVWHTVIPIHRAELVAGGR